MGLGGGYGSGVMFKEVLEIGVAAGVLVALVAASTLFSLVLTVGPA